MPYCTLLDITKSLPESSVIELTDDSGTGIVNTETLNRAIEDADSLIDSYLIGKYDIPIDSSCKLIRKISVDLSIYNLFARRYSSSEEMPKQQSDAYKNQIKLLESIAKGLMLLSADTLESVVSVIYKTNKTISDKIFSKTMLDKM
jgi:phage gp36-like protein